MCCFFCNRSPAYALRISDWSSDVCSSDLDEFARFGVQALEALFERLDVIVAEGDDFGVAHRAAVIDRRVAVDVEDDIVALARDRRNDAEVRLISGRKHHGMIHGVKFLEDRKSVV